MYDLFFPFREPAKSTPASMTSTPDNPNKEELVEGTAKGMERDMKSLVNARDFS